MSEDLEGFGPIHRHGRTHQNAGRDAIRLDDLAATEDNTDLNSSTTAHGLLAKLSGTAADFLGGDGAFKSATTARSNMGLATSDSPEFTAVNIGHASDTTVSRASAGVIAVEGSNVLMASNIGVTVQAYDAELAALAGLTSAADKLPYFTGGGTAAVTSFSSFGRSLVDDADESAARTTLNVNTCAAKVRRGTASTFSTGSLSVVPFANEANTEEVYDTDSMYDKAGGQPTRITITTAGKYLCIGQIQWATNGTGARLVALNVNGTERARVTTPASSSLAINLCVAAVFNLAAADYVQMYGYQDSGGNLDINVSGSGGTGEQDFTVIRIGP